MEKKIEIVSVIIRLALLLLSICHVSMATKQTYIVQMRKSEKLSNLKDHTQWYTSSLRSVSPSAKVIYSYNNTINGFCVALTDEEAQAMKESDDVLSVQPDAIYELHTTRTPYFLGLDEKGVQLPNLNDASKVIIGVLDTGVSPESESYNDMGYGPIPKKWKGGCSTKRMCNKKLVGARYFMKGYENYLNHSHRQFNNSQESKSPQDTEGHGTHTSSTAGGSIVGNASLLGFGKGNARGMANYARLAMYKVCWLGGCFSSDILAAMDRAIDDGVDVLSLSIGGSTAPYFYYDVIVEINTIMEVKNKSKKMMF
ncbi:hypothetical protein CASFOL_021256 [Castilleja foliolosa]|uniref:Uncharacterized protein n=1 Tax=Castilleja foliolosa TaxID=1961234 RepID=A0ABD3D059_9LAMI